MIFLAFVIWVLVFTDMYLLKHRDRRVFVEHFCLSPLQLGAITFGVVLLTWLAAAEADWHQLPFYLMIYLLTVYLIQRMRYQRHQTVPLGTEPGGLHLAGDAVGIILYWLAGMIVFGLMLEGLASVSPLLKTPLEKTMVTALFSSLFMVWLIHRLTYAFGREHFLGVLGLRFRQQSWVKLWLWPALLGSGCAALASWLMVSRPAQPATPFSEMISSATSSWMLLAFMAVGVLFAPFFEEIIFRGFFFYVIERLKGRWFAIISIAAVFALMHFSQYWGDWAAIGVVTLLGFLLTIQRGRTGSAVPSIVTHYAFNAGMTVIPMVILLLSNPHYFEYQIRYPELTVQQREHLLKQSIERYPAHAPSYNDLAWLYAEEGENLKQALGLVNTALESDPDNYAFLDTKAEVLFQLGRIEAALAIEKELSRRYPNDQHLKQQVEKFRSALPPQE